MQYQTLTEFLTYDQISLVPVHVSTLEHRAEADTSVQLGPVKLRVPIVAAPMPDVCGMGMGERLVMLGVLPIMSLFGYPNEVMWMVTVPEKTGVAVGLKELSRVGRLLEQDFLIICLDTANGASEMVHHAVGTLKEKY